MPNIDRTDEQILALLQKNARMSNKEIGAELNLAASTIWSRVKQLEEEGVITGYRAEVNPKALGAGLQALVAVRLAQHSISNIQHFRSHLRDTPEVVAIYHVGGLNDFLLHVDAIDADHLREVILKTLAMSPEVAHLETSIIFEHARSAALPVYRRAT